MTQAEPRGVLFRRRVALGLHILFQVLVVIGVLGPWYQPTMGGMPFGDPVVGSEFVLRLGMERVYGERKGPVAATSVSSTGTGAPATPPPREVEGQPLEEAIDPPAPKEPAVWQRPGFLANLVLLAAVVAFFFTSYDLVADQDLQLAPFLCTLVIFGAAGLAYASLLHSTELLDSVIKEVGAAGKAGGGTSAPIELRLLPGLKPSWGASVFMAAAIPMLLCSIYLTFVARRQPREKK
jgi:hypothetical protein